MSNGNNIAIHPQHKLKICLFTFFQFTIIGIDGEKIRVQNHNVIATRSAAYFRDTVKRKLGTT